jgi:hypothetical protein
MYIKYLCEQHLKLNVPYRDQDRNAVKTVVSKVCIIDRNMSIQ